MDNPSETDPTMINWLPSLTVLKGKYPSDVLWFNFKAGKLNSCNSLGAKLSAQTLSIFSEKAKSEKFLKSLPDNEPINAMSLLKTEPAKCGIKN